MMDRLLNSKFAPTFSQRLQSEEVVAKTTPESIKERYEKNRLIARRFVERAESIQAPFSILLYGSTTYGYNEGNPSVCDDLDMALVIPRNVSAKAFLESAKYVFESDFEVQMLYLEGLVNGDWDLCRMYGRHGDVRLEFWLMRTDTFRYLATDNGSVQPIRDVANPKFKILLENHWSIKHWEPVMGRFEHEEVIATDGSKQLIMKNYLFAKSGENIGSLGVRLLPAISLYDPSSTSELDKRVLLSFWFIYVRSCLTAHPNLTNDEMINAITRSDRFSPEFRVYLHGVIQEIRTMLSK